MYDYKIHSLCLMTNHFHMLIETQNDKFWKIMQRMLHPYSMDFNHKYSYTRHVFESRYVLIYCKGKLIINDYKESAGIIGARRCSQEGKMEAIEKATKAAAEHKAVISGMAKGIDSYAHTAAIKAGAYTIAVLGNGADLCYPKEHQALNDSIASHGCIISEYPPGTKPREYMFPKRNRIIAALSDELLFDRDICEP